MYEVCDMIKKNDKSENRCELMEKFDGVSKKMNNIKSILYNFNIK